MKLRRERRKSKRIKKSAGVLYVPMARIRPSLSALTRDISAGGIGIPVNRGIKKGELLELEIDLPGKKPIFALGKVVWVERKAKNPAAGVKFVTIELEDKTEILDFIS